MLNKAGWQFICGFDIGFIIFRTQTYILLEVSSCLVVVDLISLCLFTSFINSAQIYQIL